MVLPMVRSETAVNSRTIRKTGASPPKPKPANPPMNRFTSVFRNSPISTPNSAAANSRASGPAAGSSMNSAVRWKSATLTRKAESPKRGILPRRTILQIRKSTTSAMLRPPTTHSSSVLKMPLMRMSRRSTRSLPSSASIDQQDRSANQPADCQTVFTLPVSTVRADP